MLRPCLVVLKKKKKTMTNKVLDSTSNGRKQQASKMNTNGGILKGNNIKLKKQKTKQPFVELLMRNIYTEDGFSG